jgi:hypothetical protein
MWPLGPFANMATNTTHRKVEKKLQLSFLGSLQSWPTWRQRMSQACNRRSLIRGRSAANWPISRYPPRLTILGPCLENLDSRFQPEPDCRGASWRNIRMVQLVPLGSCSMVWGTNSIWSVIDASGIVLLIKSQHTNLGDAKNRLDQQFCRLRRSAI